MKNKEIEFKTLHSNKKRIHFLYAFVCVVLLLIVFIIGRSFAKYRITWSIPLVNGTINNDLANLNAIAVYIEDGDDYSKNDTNPESGYIFNEEKSYCTVNGEEDTSITVSYDIDAKSLSVTPMTTQGTKCYLYFDEQKTFKDIILADNGGTTAIEGKETPDFSEKATTDEGMYATTDNLGTSYYFRGAVTNNYVQFAGYYWRIIRVNGDGSIRMIYDGTSAHANGESSSDRQIGTSSYNENYNGSYYVGYTYEENSQRPTSQNGGTASTIKGVLDNWYQVNIAGKEYDDKVTTISGFCNDRTLQSGSIWSIDNTHYYAGYKRGEDNSPSLQCKEKNDLYTFKVGLITSDEVSFAGATHIYGDYNLVFYLYTGQDYWTMTPAYFYKGGGPYVAFVTSGGDISMNYEAYRAYIGVRPVINLSADVTISSGNGTSSNPYVVN